tara:strand:- start:239 stop:1417 length:1179 start_codon:yes stop_codon:yes gene_type:complete
MWIKQNTPSGISQNQFLKNIISSAREEEFRYSLFSKPIVPSYLYGKLPFKFIDLFAGIGGFRCALTSVGGKCVFSSEWDKYANITYKAWYGDNDVNTEDIRTIDAKRIIPDHDILCAGFPCQPFSIAGVSKKKSLGRKHGFEDEEQGNLFEKIMDIVDAKRPPILFLENVKNLKSHDKGNTWRRIKLEIEKRNYILFSQVIDARNWVPQHRERIFIVCFDRKTFCKKQPVNFEFPNPQNNEQILLKNILETLPDEKYMLSDKLWQYLKDYAAKHKAKGNGFGFGLNTRNDVSRTMSARYYKDGAEILIHQDGWKNPRRLTPREAMFLMGFQNRYAEFFGHNNGFPQVVSDTQAYKQFGNSVVPLVVEEIAKNIVEIMVHHLLDENTGRLLVR